MTSTKLNPFHYGGPVPTLSFVGRESVIRTIFSRINNCESTAIIGSFHIGKSSALCYVMDENVKLEWLGKMATQCAFINIDCQMIPSEYKPTDFWKHVLIYVERFFPDEVIRTQCDTIRQNDFGSFVLKRLFDLLAQKDWRVVLVIDEFDVLLYHPNFNTAEFFGALRALSTLTRGLVLVIASRLRTSEMDKRTQEINPAGSPYFNTIVEVKLRHLDQNDVDKLLDRSLTKTHVIFSTQDREFIRWMTGYHPYLVQVTAAALFESAIEGRTGEDKYRLASETIYYQTDMHFSSLWRTLSRESQTALIILVLAELNGYVDKRNFDTGDLGNLDWYGPELHRLVDLGLVEKVSEQQWHLNLTNLVIWHGHRWRISSENFVWWIINNAIANTRQGKSFGEWLQDEEFEGLLTRGEKDKLKEMAGKIPKSAIASIGELIRTITKGWLTGGK